MPYFHHVPGRLRIRTASLKRNVSAAASVRAVLSMASGVTSSEVNTITGSILVHYDSRFTSPAAICSMLHTTHSFLNAPNASEAEAPKKIRRPERAVVARRNQPVTQSQAFENVSARILTFLFQMLIEQAIETAAKRGALLLIAMIL